jgi:serine/threonine-protein kinase RIO1
MDNFIKKKFDCLYIYNYLRPLLFENISNQYTDYIVFHTKVRYDGLIKEYKEYIIPKLNEFFSTFKTNKTILIMGERNMLNNKEVIIHKTFSLYNNIMLLKNNNKIIDLTKNVLVDGNNNFNDFLQDIQIINGALCNITFGVGGPYCITLAFSKNNVSFLPFINKSPHYKMVNRLNIISNSLVDNTDMLFQNINKYII